MILLSLVWLKTWLEKKKHSLEVKVQWHRHHSPLLGADPHVAQVPFSQCRLWISAVPALKPLWHDGEDTLGLTCRPSASRADASPEAEGQHWHLHQESQQGIQIWPMGEFDSGVAWRGCHEWGLMEVWSCRYWARLKLYFKNAPGND